MFLLKTLKQIKILSHLLSVSVSNNVTKGLFRHRIVAFLPHVISILNSKIPNVTAVHFYLGLMKQTLDWHRLLDSGYLWSSKRMPKLEVATEL